MEKDTMNAIVEYYESQDYAEYYRSLDDDNARLKNIIVENRENVEHFKSLYMDKVASWKAARGGGVVRRGYFLPSPVMDLVVGGCNRGRLLKKVPEDKQVDYLYGFDSNEKLIVVINLPNTKYENYEFVSNSENYSLGLREVNPGEIDAATECLFNGDEITQYTWRHCYRLLSDDSMREKYVYLNNRLASMDSIEYRILASGKPYKMHLRYYFEHDDEEGYINGFRIARCFDGKAVKRDTDDMLYRPSVRAKRKV